jgi:hypothetical protein
MLSVLYGFSQKQAGIVKFNGTYFSPTNLYKNNNYLRVYFLNDSTFIFTMIVAYDAKNNKIDAESDDLRLNGHSVFGMARLLSYNGSKSWIGLLDQFSSYELPSDAGYLSSDGRGNFESVLRALSASEKDAFTKSGFKYNVYQFSFSTDGISMKGITGVSRFFEGGEYHKVDNTVMKLGVGANDMFFQKNHNDYTPAIVTNSCFLLQVPTEENILENKPSVMVKQGDKVFLTGYDFTTFTFIVQYDKNFNVLKSGWVKRNDLRKH